MDGRTIRVVHSLNRVVGLGDVVPSDLRKSIVCWVGIVVLMLRARQNAEIARTNELTFTLRNPYTGHAVHRHAHTASPSGPDSLKFVFHLLVVAISLLCDFSSDAKALR